MAYLIEIARVHARPDLRPERWPDAPLFQQLPVDFPEERMLHDRLLAAILRNAAQPFLGILDEELNCPAARHLIGEWHRPIPSITFDTISTDTGCRVDGNEMES